LERIANADVIQEDEEHWNNGRLWVPDSVDLRKMLPQDQHDSKVACNIGQGKTIKHVQRNFL
jgi:hypothetical protein